jgi:hypothetical protein
VLGRADICEIFRTGDLGSKSIVREPEPQEMRAEELAGMALNAKVKVWI